MSRGTTYNIYQAISKDSVVIDWDLVAKNYDLVHTPYMNENHKNEYSKDSLPDVIDGDYFLNGELIKDEYGRINWPDEDFIKPHRYFLKDGREVQLIGSWDLCSWSIFIMSDVLDYNTNNDEKIIDVKKVDAFIDAVDFALHCKRLKTNKGADYVEAVRKNFMISTLADNGMVPLPSTVGAPNDYEYEESAVLEVRDIFKCFKTLCSCDGRNRDCEKIITVGYWG